MENVSPIITVLGVRFLNLPAIKPVLNEIVEEDCYQLDRIPNNSMVIDGGSFYGEFALLCNIHKQCPVLAFEPVPINCEIARINQSLNDTHQFYLRNCALSISDDDVSVFYKPYHPAGSSLDQHTPDMSPSKVPSESLSSAISFCQSNFPTLPITLKLDVEGTEKTIFSSELSWLSKLSIVTMEWHNYDALFYRDILVSYGFSVELSGGGPSKPTYNSSIGAGLLFAYK